jgi:ribosomal protein L37AE/L43A
MGKHLAQIPQTGEISFSNDPFVSDSPVTPQKKPKKTRAHVVETTPYHAEDAWTLEDHVCRSCFGRLVSRPLDSGLSQYQCSNCGLVREGHSAEVLCACGMKVRKSLRNAMTGNTLIDAGIRCIRNTNTSPEFPSLIVAIEKPVT